MGTGWWFGQPITRPTIASLPRSHSCLTLVGSKAIALKDHQCPKLIEQTFSGFPSHFWLLRFPFLHVNSLVGAFRAQHGTVMVTNPSTFATANLPGSPGAFAV